MAKLKYCMVTNNIAEYEEYKTKNIPNIYDLIKILDGEIYHSRYLLPVLKSKNFDIIHINFSKDDFDLINSIREIIGENSIYKTKILVSFNMPFKKIKKMNLTDKNFSGADFLFTVYESDIKPISNLVCNPVWYFDCLKNNKPEIIRKKFFDLLDNFFYESHLRYKSLWMNYDLCNDENMNEPERNKILFENNIILGCNTSHDGCVSLLKNNELVFSIEAEKDSNLRYKSFFNDIESHLRKLHIIIKFLSILFQL